MMTATPIERPRPAPYVSNKRPLRPRRKTDLYLTACKQLGLLLCALATARAQLHLAPAPVPPGALLMTMPGGPPPPPKQQQQPPPGTLLTVPGSESLLRQADRVDRLMLPYENWSPRDNSSSWPTDFRNSYVIDHKRFVEPYSSRCFSSTLLDDPDSVEPNFVIVRAGSERRVNATAPAAHIQAAGFDARLRTTLLVHGFTQSYPSTDWLRKARALFELHGLVARENLIIMDWGTGSSGSYAQVAAQVSGMGSFLANFLLKLIDELGADRRNIHLVGHSLGAHLTGFAGKRIQPKLGRITALDAAGPCFGKFFSNSPNDRLSPNDALEVDVFHYDDDFLGLSTQIGHFDVFVNGGSSQPGAVDNMNAMVQALVTMVFRRNRVLSESHTRSTEVATSQLSRTNCQLMAYECRDWPAFLSGECGHCDPDNSQCFFMSFHFQYANMDPQPLRIPYTPSTALGKKFFIATSSSDLYCLNHFQILIRFQPAPNLAEQARRNRWRLLLELRNERNERSNLTVTHQMAPTVFSYLFLSEMAPSKFKLGALQVRSGADNSLVELREKMYTANQKKRPYSQPFRVLSVEVSFMSHVESRVRQALSSRLCPAGWLFEGPMAPAGISNAIADSSQAPDEWLSLAEC